jgi:FdhD protein
VAKVLVHRLRSGESGRGPAEVAVEEPLAIRLDGTLVATTMRTPGHDFELAAGFCFSEGLLGGALVQRCRYCASGSAGDTGYNVVDVETGGQAPPPAPRLGLTTSACGLCGQADLIDLQLRWPVVTSPPPPLAVLAGVPEQVRAHQGLFARTGGTHAAAAFDAAGALQVVREDVGRHNAADKVVGRLLLDGAIPASGWGLFVSGRAAFELVQKAWAAGFSALVAVGAPTSLAVAAARAGGLSMAGFARNGDLTLYTEGSQGQPPG